MIGIVNFAMSFFATNFKRISVLFLSGQHVLIIDCLRTYQNSNLQVNHLSRSVTFRSIDDDTPQTDSKALANEEVGLAVIR
jgi:hypothetical protein